jgi:hypothetical protein
MPLAPEKLRIFAFPQRINGDQLEVNILLLPTQGLLNAQDPFSSQLSPGDTVQLPRFINADLSLEAKLIRGLSSYPFSSAAVLAAEGVTAETLATDAAFPPNLPALYEGLLAQFKLDPDLSVHTKGAEEPKPDSDGIRKYLPKSYRTAFNFTTPRTEFAKTDDSYHCAIKKAPQADPAFKQSPDFVTWGRIIAFCLRQPLLTERMGLLHRLTLTLPTDNYFENGGWMYFNLTTPLNEFDITNAATQLKLYAARIPDISQPRQLFAALVFPIVAGPALPNGQYDILIPETADYDDGFAKIVHAVQPVSANLLSEEPDGIHVQKDAGIRLGWDDEQLLIWQNRQVLADPTTPNQRIDAPLGVFSYRVDVRRKTNPPSDWTSLVRIRNKDELTLGGESIAPALTELETGVQVYPSKINADPATLYWLPSYFTQWYGPSLVCPDERVAQLDASGALADPGSYGNSKIDKKPAQKGGLYEPVLPPQPELKYGTEYEFRVRLADLTGGGPFVDENELNDAPAKSAFIPFRRFVAPKQLTVKPKTVQPNPNARTGVFFEGDSFDIVRPRLGYPALLFTEMDTADAFQKLVDDKTFLHKDKTPQEKIKEQREVSYFDPDVDKILVVVELKTLLLDNFASLDQSEAYIPLYTTFRKFSNDPEKPFKLELDYRDANVIDFGNEIDLGDLNISKTQIDNGTKIVLPTSRDIRITLFPVCSDKPAKLSYFGFNKTRFGEEFVRSGEPTQFFVRQDATDEKSFFKPDLESRQLQGIYLQPDPPQVVNPLSFFAELVEGKELDQATLLQRLATQLDVDFKGMTLMGKPGERIQFGCNSRIRHTLAPDNSSLTLATKDDLINHWLCVLSFEIQRDWTWDGLAEAGIEVSRTKEFTGEAATLEKSIVGNIRLINTASRVATTKPDRSYTRIVFIDAVEPKKDLTKAATHTHPFPNTIDLQYTVMPTFISSVKASAAKNQSANRELQLPVTEVPKQVPKIVAAGIALSPYQHNAEYSETAVRQRYLWFEFDEPVADPNDTYFARVLAYAPDPLLTFPNLDQVAVKQDDPPLAISPELIRVITNDLVNDNAGIDAMQTMMAETDDPAHPLVKLSPVHYLLPLPPGLHGESNELFGFFTYELRVGHTDRIWCTAQGRFGHPTRVSGVQHPAPPLKCLVDRTPKRIVVTAQYATAVFSGKDVTSKPPKTEIWCMLYAQVRQADARKNRNILLSELKLKPIVEKPEISVNSIKGKFGGSNIVALNLDAPATAASGWTEAQIKKLLDQFHLDHTTGLSVLAVEMMPRYDQYILWSSKQPDKSVRPLSQQLGQYRILRTSRLVAAPEIC